MANLSTSNVTDDTRNNFFRKALKAKQIHEDLVTQAKSANSAFRSVLKDGKKAGVDPEDITFVLAVRNMDTDVLLAKLQGQVRMLEITGIMPNIQQDLFGGPEINVSAAATAEITADLAYEDGVAAGAAGVTRTLNKHIQGSELHDAWDRGWIQGQTKIADGMKSARVAKPRKGKVTGDAAQTH